LFSNSGSADFGGDSGGDGGGNPLTKTCSQPLARNLGLSYGGAWAKGFGQMLNFNCALILYPVLRYILRKINNCGNQAGSGGGLSAWLPLHRNIDFHKLIACVIGVCSGGHIVAHFLNYGKSTDAHIDHVFHADHFQWGADQRQTCALRIVFKHAPCLCGVFRVFNPAWPFVLAVDHIDGVFVFVVGIAIEKIPWFQTLLCPVRQIRLPCHAIEISTSPRR
jgi:hypothetical protein